MAWRDENEDDDDEGYYEDGEMKHSVCSHFEK